jgi:hypothetical protein
MSALRQSHGRGLEISVLDQLTLRNAFDQLADTYDAVNPGFGIAPKFPNPTNLCFLLRYHRRFQEPFALEMVEKTLAAMRAGGIFDQIGLGFHRYSTDAAWLVPHFEKMHYDQALVSIAYTEGFAATGKVEYQTVAREVFSYVLREMTSPEGAFYSAEDADSEGEEGKYYFWTEKQIQDALPPEESRIIIQLFNIKPEGNFPEASEDGSGKNIPHLAKPVPELAKELKIESGQLQKIIDRSREKLFQARSKRVRPAKDDKILADWNGLMIASLALAGQTFDEPEYVEAAAKAADFILDNMVQAGSRLFHRYRKGSVGIPAFLDDYAFLCFGLIELYEASFEVKYLKKAMDLTRTMLKAFWDDQDHGLFFSGSESDPAIAREKKAYDSAVPSGNSVALLNLLRLSQITNDSSFQEYAHKLISAFSDQVAKYPAGYAWFLAGVDFSLGPNYQVVIAGDSDADETRKMIKALSRIFIPGMVKIFIPTETKSPAILDLAEYLKPMAQAASKPMAFVCKNFVCRQPVTDADQMIKLLD